MVEANDEEPAIEETSTSRGKRTKTPQPTEAPAVAAELPAKPKARVAKSKTAEQVEVPSVKPRATRAKAEAKVEQAPVEVVEDVEMVEVEETKPLKRTTGRTTKAATTKTKAVKEEVEVQSLSAIPRMAKKAVGGKKVVTVVDDVEDKENSASPPTEEQSTTGRSRGTARATRKTVKAEVVDEPMPRATRTRARK